jgi:hypothetical protein
MRADTAAGTVWVSADRWQGIGSFHSAVIEIRTQASSF